MTVYSLTASDEPLQVRYVGATVYDLEHRLRGHFRDPYNALKHAWIRAVKARGAKVVIQALSTHPNTIELLRAERRWMSFWSQYCDLLNAQAATKVHARPDTIRKKPAKSEVPFEAIFSAVGYDVIEKIIQAELEYQARAKTFRD